MRHLIRTAASTLPILAILSSFIPAALADRTTDALNESWKRYREVRRMHPQVMYRLPESVTVCSDCEPYAALTKQVSEVLRRVEKSYPEAGGGRTDSLPEQIAIMEEMHYISLPENVSCSQSANIKDFHFLDPKYDAREMTLLFSENLSPEKIRSLKISTQAATTRFLRVNRNGSEYIVRYDIQKRNGEEVSLARATYYRMEPQREKQTHERAILGNSVSGTKGERLDYAVKYGLHVFEKSGPDGTRLPERALLFDAQASESLDVGKVKSLQGRALLDSRGAGALLEFKDPNSRTLVGASMSRAPEVLVPFHDVRIFATNLKANGEIAIGTDQVETVCRLERDAPGGKTQLGTWKTRTSFKGQVSEASYSPNFSAKIKKARATAEVLYTGTDRDQRTLLRFNILW